MSFSNGIIMTAFLLYIPMAGSLLYVWWKYGKNDKGIATARITFLIGSCVLFVYMFFI